MPSRIPVAVVVLALSVPAVALAANPKKGGTYTGTGATSGGQLVKKIVVKVSANGKSGKAQIYCGTGRGPTGIPAFKISKGRFTSTKRQGSLFILSIKGRFTSATSATVTLHNQLYCDGKGGTIKLTLATG